MANEAINTAQEMNTFLAIFAVIGPIVTAAVTAWWSRRNEINNREHTKLKEQEAEARQDKKQNADKLLEFRSKEIEQLKKSVVSFISHAAECHNSAIADGHKLISSMDMIPQLILKRSELVQKLIDSFNEMYLLSPPDEILKTSESLLDFISRTPFEEYQKGLHSELSVKFRDLKTNVLDSTKKYIKNEQDTIIKSLQ